MNLNLPYFKQLIYAAVSASLVLAAGGVAANPVEMRDITEKQELLVGELIATGVRITPTAVPGSVFEVLDPEIPDAPEFRAGQGVTTAVSPDGKTLLVLTSGYNYWADEDYNTLAFDEYVFVYDISSGIPVKTQVITVPNSFMGIVWNPNGDEFYVAGGMDDNVHVFRKHNDTWGEFGTPIHLGHAEGNGLDTDGVSSISWLITPPLAAGLAVNASGDRLLVANMENDSVSLINLSDRSLLAELDLRPGKNDPSEAGVPGGEFPYWVSFKGDAKAYVSSLRDREILILDLTDDNRSIAKRLPVKGNPGRMLLNKAQSKLYVALDNLDAVALVDTDDDEIRRELDVNTHFKVGLEDRRYTGSHPNGLALSPDEHTLFITLGGGNAVAVVDLTIEEDEEHEKGKGREVHERDESNALIGLIPTGWYPGSVSLSADGRHMYVINALSSAGPNPEGCRSNLEPSPSCKDGINTNQYILQMRLGGLLSLPVPNVKELPRLTRQVLYNNSVLDRG